MSRAPRTAIVTGAASGIGRATAERLTRDEWRVIGVDLRTEMPANVEALVADASDPETYGRAVELAGHRLGGLVCAAGIAPNERWEDADAWNDLLRVDLSGPFNASRVCMPALEAAHGSIVIVGSILGGMEGSGKSPGYAAAKAGLEGLVRSLALIGASNGVRANVVAPGAIDTPFDPPRFPADDRPDVPLGRMGTADEVAAAICFLLSEDASYVTGTVLRVDGGRSVLSPGSAIRS
jgi:NAD(P)-dependent dehydrogenase (short-subunit alcohol dehydrogenase family)